MLPRNASGPHLLSPRGRRFAVCFSFKVHSVFFSSVSSNQARHDGINSGTLGRGKTKKSLLFEEALHWSVYAGEDFFVLVWEVAE